MEYAGNTTRIPHEEWTTLKVLKESHGKLISRFEFESQVNLDDFIEEGESLSDLIRQDPDTCFYSFLHEGKMVFGVNSSGVDSIFTEDGELPPLGGGLDSSLANQCRRSQLAWVLAPCGSLLAAGPMGEETETFRTSSLARFDGSNGSTRIQLLRDGEVVSGMQVKNDTIEAIYTDWAHTRKGYASQLLNYAYKMFPDLQHNQSLTDDGMAFVNQYEQLRHATLGEEAGFHP